MIRLLEAGRIAAGRVHYASRYLLRRDYHAVDPPDCDRCVRRRYYRFLGTELSGCYNFLPRFRRAAQENSDAAGLPQLED
jgi:hypothetical protein